jgi:hypothetical protein
VHSEETIRNFQKGLYIMKQFIQNAFPNLPEKLFGLGELAYNLWWSWHPEGRMLFKMIDRQIWKERGHPGDEGDDPGIAGDNQSGIGTKE